VVLIAEKHKERFVSYLKNKLAGKDDEFHYDTLKGKKIRIKWHADHIHVDGYVVESEKAKELKVDLLEGAVHFLVP
jgi:diacylglycerol kinase (ATP)